MGHLQATEMAEFVGLDAGLYWHLRSNHYPPVHPIFADVAKQAVETGARAVMEEDYALLDEVVTMPNGIEKSLGDIVEGLHLEAFIDQYVAEEVED